MRAIFVVVVVQNANAMTNVPLAWKGPRWRLALVGAWNMCGYVIVIAGSLLRYLNIYAIFKY